MHGWSTFGAQTNHGHTWTHKTHHGSHLREATTIPLILFFMPYHRACTQMSFCTRTLKLKVLKLGLSQLWRPITFCADLRLRWGIKKSCNPCQDLSKGMWHVTWMQINQSNSWLLVVGSQIGSLIPRLFFGHDLCFKYSNGTCKLILNI
jgi:hypothetical protein